MERLTHDHIEEIKNAAGEVIRTVNHGPWLTDMDWYSVCENACLLYDVDAENEPDCAQCPLKKSFAKLSAFENAEADGRIVVMAPGLDSNSYAGLAETIGEMLKPIYRRAGPDAFRDDEQYLKTKEA